MGELCCVSVYSKCSFTYYCSSSPIQSATSLLKKLDEDDVLDNCLGCRLSCRYWEVCNICHEMQCSECVGTKKGVQATIWKCRKCKTTTCLSCRVTVRRKARFDRGLPLALSVVSSCSENDPLGKMSSSEQEFDEGWPHRLCGQCRFAECENDGEYACFRCKSYAFDLRKVAKRRAAKRRATYDLSRARIDLFSL